MSERNKPVTQTNIDPPFTIDTVTNRVDKPIFKPASPSWLLKGLKRARSHNQTQQES